MNRKSTHAVMRNALLGLYSFLFACLYVGDALGNSQVAQVQLPGKAIAQFVDPLPHFAGLRVDATKPLRITMEEIQQRVLPSTFVYPAPFTGTYVWGYKVEVLDGLGNVTATYPAHYPAFSLDAVKDIPTTITFVNNLQGPGGTPPFLQQYLTVDQTLHWANPLGLDHMDPNRMMPYTGPVPAVVHVHGAEVPSDFDGGPDQWYTASGIRGPGYRSLVPAAANSCVYRYPNTQEGTTIWYHDHTLGGTRLNVYAGLAGYFLLRDWYDPISNPDGTELPNLPGGPTDSTVVDNSNPAAPRTIKAEIEIAIQDRMFDTNGQLFFPDIGLNPEHPFWIPEFFGDTILVNGRPWPFLNVEPRRYRFRFLDGSNSRFYNMWLDKGSLKGGAPVFWQIGTDGGMLDKPVMLNKLLMGPGERADIIIDFSAFAGKTLILRNDANSPFPNGAGVTPGTTDRIMQFRVGTTLSAGADPSYNPTTLAPLRAPMSKIDPALAVTKRQLTLNEVMGMMGPMEVLVNNTKWVGKRPDGTLIPGSIPDTQGNYMTELPIVGSTEVWEIINLTADAHPIHLHLAQFQLINRQDIQTNKYLKAYEAAFPGGMTDPMTGLAYLPGVYIPAYGPPLDYTTLNADGAVGGNPAVLPFLQKAPTPPNPNELGWKDTVLMYPGQVTRIAVRFTKQNGNPYSFDATGLTPISFDKAGAPALGPGYVWHCHIVDHEDNEMMRPYNPIP